MAQRATSLGPKPSLFIIFCFFGLLLFLSFLCFVIQKNRVFPPRKGIFCLFLSVSLCFSLAFLELPLFQFLFLCLSLLLVLFPFFPVFLVCFLLLPCLSLSFLFFLLCFCFMKRTTSEYSITKLFFMNVFSFLVSCLLFSLNPFFLSLFLLLI